MSPALLAGLLFAPLVLADSPLQVTEVHQPESPAWGTNTVTVTIRNAAASAREVMVNYQTRNQAVGKGWGADANFTIPASETKTISTDVTFPAFPGKTSYRFTVRDAADNSVLWTSTTDHEFPFANRRTAPLRLTAGVQESLHIARREYPALRMEQRGRLIIYYLDGDSWIAGRIDAIAAERARVYQDLVARINPKFDREIALYLFPDADSKLAYTIHRGLGWASGRILAEIFNERDRIDPYHEVCHIIAGSVGSPPAMLDEGLAAWSQEGHRWDGIAVDSWAKAFAARGALWPVEKLYGFPEIGSEATRGPIAYPQSASLVGYLIDRFGWEKFLGAYRVLQRKSDDAAFTAAFGIDLATLEKDWRQSLASPEIEPAPQSRVDAELKK
jgi:hypothetical protein